MLVSVITRLIMQRKDIGTVKNISVTASVTSYWSSFVRCSVYSKSNMKFMHSCNKTENGMKEQC
jgi:hypothetical protein